MTQIEIFVLQAIENFRRLPAEPPPAIYLGAAEYRQMREIFREKALIEVPADCRHAEAKRMEYLGLKIYRVDTEHHLFVG